MEVAMSVPDKKFDCKIFITGLFQDYQWHNNIYKMLNKRRILNSLS